MSLDPTRVERDTAPQVSLRFDSLPAALLACLPASLRPGKRVLGTAWTVVRSLGRGGIGEVFEVEHALLGKRAALKVLQAEHASRAGLAARIAAEGRLLASVRHDNLVEVLDLGLLEPDGRPYLVLELLEGRDLRQELSRVGVFSVPAALGFLAQALEGLGALHRAGIVHCDLKLENLFLCGDGRLKILDLGAAEGLDRSAGRASRGFALGTPRMMAPEQAAGGVVEPRTDLYALGLVLYELIAGRGPFDDVGGIEAFRFAHASRVALPPSAFASQAVPPEVDALVLRALAKSPDDRFPSAEAMAVEVAALRRGPLPPAPGVLVPTLSSALPSPRRRPILRPGVVSSFQASASALALAALALGLALGRLLPSG